MADQELPASDPGLCHSLIVRHEGGQSSTPSNIDNECVFSPMQAFPLRDFFWPSDTLTNFPKGRGFAWAACLASIFFFIGMSLWGTSPYAGHFYVVSLLIGAPILLAMRPWKAPAAWPIQVYGLIYSGFVVFCIVDVLFRDAPSGTIEYSARFLLGIVNGYFFLQMFGGNRQTLFRFMTLVSGTHLIVAVSYTLYAGFDFSSLSILHLRPGGNTNPIAYSLLILSSAGIVALALTDQVRPDRKYVLVGAVALTVAASLLAVAVTGTRGTVIAVPLLLGLVAALLWLRAGAAWSLVLIAIFTVAFGIAATGAIHRDPDLMMTTWRYLTGEAGTADGYSSAGQRYDLWIAAMRLIPEQPLFGFGFGAMPEVLMHPAAGVPEDSIIHGYGHIHNEYLDILLKAGIVGAVLFYAPMIVALTIAFSKLREPAFQACAFSVIWLVGAQLVYGLTSVMFAHAASILQFGVYLGMLVFALSGMRDQVPLPAERIAASPAH